MLDLDYQIEMLNVDNADALIIFYKEKNQNFKDGTLILVDAGRYDDGEKILKHLNKYYKGMSVDLAIVTHCDEDHFGGYVYMLEKLADKDKTCICINEFWVNVPGDDHITPNEIKWLKNQERINERANSVYDVKNGNNLIDLIDKLEIKRNEVFSDEVDETEKKIFPYITVLGPSKSFYESLVPDLRYKDKLHFFDESQSMESADVLESRTLDEETDDNSANNKSSIIFIFEPQPQKKYLFAGDASRKSFEKIFAKLWAQAKNCFWLKVPHHGSVHNLDTDIIQYVHPKVAYVSTRLYEGDENAIEKKKSEAILGKSLVEELSNIDCKIFSTHKYHANFLHHKIKEREEYIPATPIN